MGFLDEAKAKAEELKDKVQDKFEDLKDKVTGEDDTPETPAAPTV